MLVSKTPVPPCGWNSYDSYGVYIDEAAAMANLKAFVEKLVPFGFEYFTLDAAWYADGDFMDNYRAVQAGRTRFMNIDQWGRFVGSPKMFPHGLRAFSDACHAAGVKFGLHMMRGIPARAVEENTPVKGHPTARARDIVDLDHGCVWCDYVRGVNMDAPGAQEFYDSVAEYLVQDLQVDFVKLDDVTDFPREIEAFARALDKQPRPVVLSLSAGGTNAPVSWPTYAKWGNMARISRDVWDREDDCEHQLACWLLFENCGGPDCWIDLDMLPLGGIQMHVPPETPEECRPVLGCRRQSSLPPAAKRRLMAMQALACSPLIYGGDLPASPDEDIALVTHPEVLACNRNGIVAQQVASVRHLDVRRAPRKDDPSHGWIGVFHRGFNLQTDLRERLSAEELGFADRIPVSLRDAWTGTPVPVTDGAAVLTIPAHGSLFLAY